ncbi:hypothetical protein [Adhaeribacter aquaticus]|uniref:hypothetical protein n=1 Tax=Adhaeribacter aquaticus TaxID=299567 RepID=UPI0012F78113|nr:hypothetical protein [Adhaeribacter aquaticus]
MEHKYNQLSIERYSADLAKLLCDRYFGTATAINGQQLIAFMPVKQVNLFVIKELLLNWNKEMANLKSPYFDFENEEVKEALVQFMNVLSRKILIKRPHFEPLLTKAITDTFLWVLDPAKVFEEKFLKVQDTISADKLQTHLKYIAIQKDYLKGFLENLVSGPLPYGNVLNQFKTYLQRNKPETNLFDTVAAEFNQILPFNKASFLEMPSWVNGFEKEDPFAPEPEKPQNITPSFPEQLVVTPKVEPATPKEEELKPVSVSPTPINGHIKDETIQNLRVAEARLNDKLRVEKSTLNERLGKPVTPSLLSNQMDKKIESLKDSISINQRFSFINELFNGENMEYYNAIQRLDQFGDAESAKNFVTQDLATKYKWAKKEEHVNKLLKLIERKFTA